MAYVANVAQFMYNRIVDKRGFCRAWHWDTTSKCLHQEAYIESKREMPQDRSPL